MIRSTAFLALLLLVPVRGLAAPEAPRLLASAPAEVRVEVPFGAPLWRTETLDDRTYRYPVWDGLAGTTDPGEPRLPSRLVRVAVPPEGTVRVEARAAAARRVADVRFPPAPTWRPADDPGDFLRRDERPRVGTLEEGAGYTAVGSGPRVVLRSVGVERGVRVALLEVFPAVWDAGTGTAEIAETVELTVRVDGARVPATGRPRPDTVGDALLRHTVVNPDDARAWRALDAAQLAGTVPDRWYDDADGWVRLPVRTAGVYRITRDRLAALGLPVDTLDPRRLRLFSGPLLAEFRWDTTGTFNVVKRQWHHVEEKTGFTEGFGEATAATDGRPGMEEIAIWVPGEEDGSLDAGDEIVFYALGPDGWGERYGTGDSEYVVNPYTSETMYWLGWETDDAEFPAAPRRMATASAAPAGGATEVTTVRDRLHYEENTWYDPTVYNAGDRWEEYFADQIDEDAPGLDFIDLPGFVPGTTLDVRARLWGANVPAGSGDAALHHARLEVNGVSAPVVAWGGVSIAQSFLPVDAYLDGAPGQATRNRVTVFIPEVGPNPDRTDKVNEAWIEIAYTRSLAMTGASLEFPLPAAAGPRAVRVDNVPSGETLVLDVTDFRSPIRLLDAETAGGGVRFDPRRADAGVFHVGRRAAPPAEALAVDTPPDRWLRDASEPVDYLILAHDSLLDAAEELAAWRRDHLPGITDTRPARVRVVKVSDVYDEFSWGMVDPNAIRWFLEYAFRAWGQPGSDPLSHVLFLGDHSYDPRDHEGTGFVDQVPSWEDNREAGFGLISYGNLQWVSDDPLIRFDGRDDLLPDLVSGRITARTPALALTVVRDKIIHAELDPDRGPWRLKSVLVADDICQTRKPDPIGFGHMTQTEALDRTLPAGLDRDKIYLYDYGEECVYDGKPDARADLVATWNEGAWLVNYIGHGADAVLADEQVFTITDVPLLTNQGRLPVFGAFSCSVGKFSKPLGGGLGEALLNSPAGGALGCAVATHLTFSGQNSALNQEWLRQLFLTGQESSLGQALFRAKALNGGQPKYIYFGDPASRANLPELALGLDGPDAIRRGETVDLAVTVPGGRTGTLDVRANDAREVRATNDKGQPIPPYVRDASTLFRGQATAAGDTSRVRFVVPLSLREGNDGKIRVYASGNGWDGSAALTDLPVGGAGFAPDDTVGPLITLDVPGDVLVPGATVGLDLTDPAGIDLTRLFDFRGILVRFQDAEGVEVLRLDLTDRFAYELDSFTAGSVTFTGPDLDPGAYTVVITAYDNYTNKSTLTRAVSVGGGGGGGTVSAVYAYPNPFAEATDVQFRLDRPAEVHLRVFTVAGRLVIQDRLNGQAGVNSWPWDGRDSLGDPVANGVYLLQIELGQGDSDSEEQVLEKLVVYR